MRKNVCKISQERKSPALEGKIICFFPCSECSEVEGEGVFLSPISPLTGNGILQQSLIGDTSFSREQAGSLIELWRKVQPGSPVEGPAEKLYPGLPPCEDRIKIFTQGQSFGLLGHLGSLMYSMWVPTLLVYICEKMCTSVMGGIFCDCGSNYTISVNAS